MPNRKKLISNEMGNRIIWLREQKGWTQVELAEKAQTTQGMISGCEKGEVPRIDIFFRIASALETNVHYLWTGENNEGLPESPIPRKRAAAKPARGTSTDFF